MKHRTLGNSDLAVSELALGCMSLPTDIDEAAPIIQTALDCGINYFDTADLYNQGANEEMLGQLLKPVRDEVYIATKVGNKWVDGEEGWSWDASADYINRAVRNSLKRLDTDYIDLYQLHGGTSDDNLGEVIETFEALKKEGLIREYGISSIRPNVISRFVPNSDAVSVMMQYSILDRRPEEWFPMIEQANASVVSRGTIAKGLLSYEWKERITEKGYESYDYEALTALLTTLEQTYGNLQAAALAFNLNNTAIASTVIGASSNEQLNATLAAYELSQEIVELSVIEQHAVAARYDAHR